MLNNLPKKPNLRYLKNQAKSILKQHKEKNPACCAILKLTHKFSNAPPEDILNAKLSLQEIHHAIALVYGFKNWKELKDYIQLKEKDMSDTFTKDKSNSQSLQRTVG